MCLLLSYLLKKIIYFIESIYKLKIKIHVLKKCRINLDLIIYQTQDRKP